MGLLNHPKKYNFEIFWNKKCRCSKTLQITSVECPTWLSWKNKDTLFWIGGYVMALICNYITTWTIHNFKSNVNIKSNVNVCDDLSIAFVCIPIQQCNKPYQMLVTPGRGRQRWPAMAICKIQPAQFQDVAYHRWSVTSIAKPWRVRFCGIGNCPIPVSGNPRRANSCRSQKSTTTSFGESMVDRG